LNHDLAPRTVGPVVSFCRSSLAFRVKNSRKKNSHQSRKRPTRKKLVKKRLTGVCHGKFSCRTLAPYASTDNCQHALCSFITQASNRSLTRHCNGSLIFP